MQAIEVALPGGYWADDGTFVDHVAMRPIAGADEEWLQGCAPSLPAGLVAAGLLQRCVVDLDIARLPVGDRDYLLLRLRFMTFGDHVAMVVDCRACGVPMDVGFDSDDVPVEWRRQARARHRIEVHDASGRKRRVVFRLPTAADVNATIADSRPERALIASCIESVDGRLLTRRELDRALDRTARAELDRAMEALAASATLGMRLTCPGCGHHFDFDVDIAPLVLEELDRAARHLWSEVHHLAFNYHWAETDILRLSRQRRRWYVGLINEALRGAASQ